MSARASMAFVLGAWIAATLFMWAVATQNFRLVDRLLASPSPQFRAHVAPLPPGDARLVMRYQASEVNRLFFDRWGWTQLALGVILLGMAWRGSADRALRIAVLLMLLIAAGLQFGVVPETIRLGRLLDFVPHSPGSAGPPEVAPFWRLHTAYTALDMLKFLVGIFAATRLLRPGAA